MSQAKQPNHSPHQVVACDKCLRWYRGYSVLSWHQIDLCFPCAAAQGSKAPPHFRKGDSATPVRVGRWSGKGARGDAAEVKEVPRSSGTKRVREEVNTEEV